MRLRKKWKGGSPKDLPFLFDAQEQGDDELSADFTGAVESSVVLISVNFNRSEYLV